MSAPDLLTVRCAGPLALRARWYRSLAHALAATDATGGVLFEATGRDAVATVTVRPAALVETVGAAPAVRALRLERLPRPPPLEPPTGWTDELRTVVPRARGGGPPVPWSSVSADPPDLESLLGPLGWVGFQTAWVRGPRGELLAARRFRFACAHRDELDRRLDAVSVAVAQAWEEAVGLPMTTRRGPLGARRDWRRGGLAALPFDAWVPATTRPIERTAEVSPAARPAAPGREDGHRIVFGASGAGKTTFLARRAAEAANRGDAVVVLDLHGDLAPLAWRAVGPGARSRAIAVDVTSPPVPGIAALAAGTANEDRAAAHLVAALKRLSPDGTDLHWGFRLERIFDSFVRLVQESEGTLVDLYALLTEADRRDAARLGTRRDDLARFLEELGPVLRRQPDFLWSAATRLSKVVLVPALRELLAPADGGLAVEEALGQGRPLFVRLPFAVLGPEAAAFAGTLVLARLYLGLAARRGPGTPARPILIVLDEVHGFAPRLVAELLTESRKFGLRALVATQYPERLAPELRAAAGGALSDVVSFRVPRRSARSAGEWVGLPGDEAERLLPGLPAGHGVRFDAEAGVVRLVPPVDPLPLDGPDVWATAVEATRRESGVVPGAPDTAPEDRETLDRLLLAVLAAEEEGRPLREESVVDAARALPGTSAPPDVLWTRWTAAVRQGYVRRSEGALSLTVVGERHLGLSAPTAASRESAEHRALLVAAFRLFARRGYRIEILRQGRFDTTLPDAVFRQIPSRPGRAPCELAEDLDRARRGWAWRYFSGRDVHLEAEVSGALRADRIRRGWHKAEGRGACVLFLVGDAARARRVRATLTALGVGADRARVWTLPVLRPGAGPSPRPNP
jgi:Type IV secretion-system coupling protein DNA-binding domain